MLTQYVRHHEAHSGEESDEDEEGGHHQGSSLARSGSATSDPTMGLGDRQSSMEGAGPSSPSRQHQSPPANEDVPGHDCHAEVEKLFMNCLSKEEVIP